MASGRRSALAIAAIAGLGVLLAPVAFGAAAGSFAPTGLMGTPRESPAVAPLADGRVLVAGGFDGSNYSDTAEIFNPATNTFSPVSSLLGIGREGGAAVLLGNGHVLIAGGFNPGISTLWLQSSEIYNPTNNSFTPVSDMSVIRSAPAGAPIPGGKALIAGGFDASGGTSVYRSSAEIFTPGSNSYSSAVGSMATGRVLASGASLPDGRVLVAGGENASSVLRSAEIFDPGANSFGPAGGQLTVGRAGAGASPLPDGRVLIAGGATNSGANLSSAEAFDPATSSFSSTGIGALGTPRFQTAAAPLPDGRVLVVGGDDTESHPLRTAEVFTLASASKVLAYRVKGKVLSVDVQVPGTVSVAAAGGKKASAAKKRKRKAPLRSTRASGGPGTITLPLRPAGAAKQKLRRKGKVKILATISFAPQAGACAATFKSCYSSQFASSQTAKLKIKLKKKKK